MKRYLLIFMAAVAGCASLDTYNPYEGRTYSMKVDLNYPEGYGSYLREGVFVEVKDIDKGSEYRFPTTVFGNMYARLPNGNYRVTVSDKVSGFVFNGSADKIIVSGKDVSLSLNLVRSLSGPLVIKEIYCGGCLKYPHEGNYQSDKYVIVHNNDVNTQYLDGLCFASLDPYNSTSQNVWVTKDPVSGESVFPDFVPIIQTIWQFKGDGDDFPLLPGEDAVICVNGAIDHTVNYPLSVNLNKPDYFVCYNSTYYTNVTYHPAPGNMISQDRILDAVMKFGKSNSYVMSLSSPAVVIFRPEGVDIRDFIADQENVADKPGSTNDKVAKVPVDWIIDAVEVFTPGASNAKRLCNSLDAGSIVLSTTFMGHTLFRKTDLDASEALGFEVLQDTNNSTNDFYERETQFLHE